MVDRDETPICETNSIHGKRDHNLCDAYEIQRLLIPGRVSIPGIELSCAWFPALEVSGDYIDVLRLGDRRFALCVGDVSGKGMAAALVMMALQAHVRALAAAGNPPRLLCTELNDIIRRSFLSKKFVTFFYGILDIETWNFSFTNAGHYPPILVRADGSVLRLDEGGPLLGIFPYCEYQEGRVVLAPQDRLLLFTDGVLASGDASPAFDEGDVTRIAIANRHKTSAELQEAILQPLRRVNGFEDDASIIVLALDVVLQKPPHY